MGNIYIHIARPVRDAEGPKHDPKNGQFASGGGSGGSKKSPASKKGDHDPYAGMSSENKKKAEALNTQIAEIEKKPHSKELETQHAALVKKRDALGYKYP